MANLLALLVMSFLSYSLAGVPIARASFPQPETFKASKIQTVYDRRKDKTTVRLAPVLISRAKDKYYSLHMAPAFSYPGHEPRTPEIIDFEIRTVVKGKLKIDYMSSS